MPKRGRADGSKAAKAKRDKTPRANSTKPTHVPISSVGFSESVSERSARSIEAAFAKQAAARDEPPATKRRRGIAQPGWGRSDLR